MKTIDRMLVRRVGSQPVDPRVVARSDDVRVWRRGLFRWAAGSTSGVGTYMVDVKPWRREVWCSCPDSRMRKHTCKHGVAVVREMLLS